MVKKRKPPTLLELLTLRDRVRKQLRDLNYLIEMAWDTGPENSRDEVAPMGSSTQRDCRTERVAPAFPILSKRIIHTTPATLHPTSVRQMFAQLSIPATHPQS